MSSPPESITEIFEELKNEVLWMHGRWTIYRQLYAKSDKRLDMLNRTSAAFFIMVQELLIGDIQLTLCKLTDSAGRGGKKRLSLEQLQKQVARHDQGLSSRLRQVLDDLKVKCQVFRRGRNERLAYLDFTTAMKKGAQPLPGVSRQMIEDALSLVREYMNTIERHYDQSETLYQHPIMGRNDGNALVSVLEHGFTYLELLRDEETALDELHEGKSGDA